MPPPYSSPPRRGPVVGALLAVIAGLLLGGVVGLALHDGDSGDGGTAATTTTTHATGGTSSSTSATSAGGGGTPTSTTVTGAGTTTSTPFSSTSPTTAVPGPVPGRDGELAHTGGATDAGLLVGLALGALALAARRATPRPSR